MKSKFKYRIQQLAALLLVACLASLSACEDDEQTSDEVVLLSFGPSGVHHGEEITFFGQSLDKVSAIIFYPAVEVSRSSFVSSSSDRINVIIPDEAKAGKVILKTSDGDVESKTLLNLDVPVVITSISKEAKPGTNITITGDKVNWIESVTFASDLLVEQKDFVSQSLTELVVTVPMEAQTGYLAFTSGGTQPLDFHSEEQLIVTLPVVTKLDPASIRHTDNLTLMGTDLDLVTEIAFPGGTSVLTADFVSQSETQIVVPVPATAMNGHLTLTVPSLVTVETATEIAIILPKVTSLLPANTSNHTPGTTLTMMGTDLDLVGEIKFPGVTAAVTDFTMTPTQIDVVIPAGVQGGTVILTTIHGFSVPVELPFGDQLVLAKAIFTDSPQNGFGVWGGWGGATFSATSTENPRVGTVGVKVTFAGDWGGAAQFGGGNLSTAGTTYFAFSIYGGPGTDGKEVNVNLSGKQVIVAIEEGAWKDVQIPLADFSSPAAATEVWFQDRGFSGVVYIDHIGLK